MGGYRNLRLGRHTLNSDLKFGEVALGAESIAEAEPKYVGVGVAELK